MAKTQYIMRKIFFICSILFFSTLFFIACEDKDNEKETNTGGGGTAGLSDNAYNNRWIYSKMKSMYLWNDELPSKPDYEMDSEKFFKSVLYNYGNINGDRFSWIEKDDEKGAKTLYGSAELGFDYIPSAFFVTEEDQYSSIGFFIISVNKGSDAEAKGLKRGDVIFAVDEKLITSSNYSTILDNSTFKLSIYNKQGEQETLAPITRSSTSDQSPLFISKVLDEYPGIGYLMYNAFERGIGEGVDRYKYDIELLNSISDLKNQGISDLIIDLRYNLGGYVTSATNLASSLVSDDKNGQVFAIEKYNTHFQDSLVNRYGEDFIYDYFLDKAYGGNTKIPKLNLKRIYIIASEYTASASELIINGLKPHMEVIQIGGTTVGKDKGSINIKSSDDDRIIWSLQPLVLRITNANGEGNYINGIAPTSGYEMDEWEEGYEMVEAYASGSSTPVYVPILSTWKGGFGELGTLSDPLLALAVSSIRNQSPSKRNGIMNTKTKTILGSIPNVRNIREDRFRMIVDK